MTKLERNTILLANPTNSGGGGGGNLTLTRQEKKAPYTVKL